MNRSSFALGAAALAFIATPSLAGTVYSNPYDPVADVGDCSFSSTCAAAVGRGNDFAAQQFTLSGSTTIMSASFTVLDIPQFAAPSSANWAFWTDASGLPGTLIASGTATSGTQSGGAPDASGFYFVDTYAFDVGSVTLGAGSYFFALQDTNSNFDHYLAQGLTDSGAAETHDGGATWSSSYEDIGGVAISLFDTPVNSVPEPITLSLFGAGLAGAVAIRRRKRQVP